MVAGLDVAEVQDILDAYNTDTVSEEVILSFGLSETNLWKKNSDIVGYASVMQSQFRLELRDLHLVLKQAIRYMVNFMHRTGLLQQFKHVGMEEDDDEPIGLTAMELGVEDDGY